MVWKSPPTELAVGQKIYGIWGFMGYNKSWVMRGSTVFHLRTHLFAFHEWIRVQTPASSIVGRRQSRSEWSETRTSNENGPFSPGTRRTKTTKCNQKPVQRPKAQHLMSSSNPQLVRCKTALNSEPQHENGPFSPGKRRRRRRNSMKNLTNDQNPNVRQVACTGEREVEG